MWFSKIALAFGPGPMGQGPMGLGPWARASPMGQGPWARASPMGRGPWARARPKGYFGKPHVGKPHLDILDRGDPERGPRNPGQLSEILFIFCLLSFLKGSIAGLLRLPMLRRTLQSFQRPSAMCIPWLPSWTQLTRYQGSQKGPTKVPKVTKKRIKTHVKTGFDFEADL